MKKSVIQIIVIIVSSILFGFLLSIIPYFVKNAGFVSDLIGNRILTIIIMVLFAVFYFMMIFIYVHSHYLIRKSRYISTLIPLRMFDSLTEHGIITFYHNLKKLARGTQKSLIYITYPVDRYNVGKYRFKLYSKNYSKTSPGKELRGFHKYLIKYIKKVLKSDKKMYFRMFVQNVSNKPSVVDDIEDAQMTSKNTEFDKFTSRVGRYKRAMRMKVGSGSVVDSYNLVSDDELIALISDNSRMLILTKMMDKYVCSFVKDPSTVKDFVAHISMKIPESYKE
jgi:ABC-type multidrug transport system fused ATPase/permease subunit